MRLTFLGVRGSIATPGASFVRYGGDTSCIAVTGGDDAVPTLALDAGSGLRALTGLLAGAPYHGQILLSHLHWDHVIGLPFFGAADREDADVRVVLPAQDGLSGSDLLAKFMSPPSFPITPGQMRGRWRFDAVEPGPVPAGPYTVRAAEIAHKGGRTFGYRVQRDGGSVAYIPDHAPGHGVSADLTDLLRGVDVLIHDAQYLDSEWEHAAAMGHCTVGDAIDLAIAAAVGTLVLFHHAPSRTDDDLDTIGRNLDGAADRTSSMRIVVAAQGDSLTVGEA